MIPQKITRIKNTKDVEDLEAASHTTNCTEYEANIDDETVKENNQEKQKDIQIKQTEKKCYFCINDDEMDKRNYHFGSLLQGELQFLPPCMRSRAYIGILKYVDSLKHQHREKVNEWNCAFVIK